MKLSAKVMVPALALLSTAAIGQTVSAYTWVGGEPDPNTVYDSVQKQDNATIPAEGTFKEWDPTDPGPGPEPTDPVDWIDVSIRTNRCNRRKDRSANLPNQKQLGKRRESLCWKLRKRARCRQSAGISVEHG